MKKLLISIDDETANLLAGEKNKSKLIREAIKYIQLDISTDTLEGLRQSYLALTKVMKDMDAKLDYIDRKLNAQTR